MKKCSNCSKVEKEDKKLKRCGACKRVFYCSRKCQVEDWNKEHRFKCGVKLIGITVAQNKVKLTDPSQKQNSRLEKVIKIIRETECWKNVPKIEINHFRRLLKQESRFIQKKEKSKKRINYNLSDRDIAEIIAQRKLMDPECPKCLKNTSYNPESIFKRCPKCHIVLYCSESCWKRDAKRHKRYCCNYNAKFRTRSFMLIYNKKYNKRFT